jgi:MFS family permease
VNILVVCLASWSVMTALCGFAQSYAQLFLARVGVGTGEAGGQPTSHSLISDLYPQGRRATATAIFQLGVPAGILIGALAGGWITQTVSWRAALVVVGLPGILLAALIKFTMQEPGRGGAEAGRREPVAAPAGGNAPPGIGRVVRSLCRTSVFAHILGASVLAAIASNGIGQFLHAFFLRSFSLGYAEAALIFGIVHSISYACGTLLGGIASDRIGQRGRWLQPIVPAVGLILGAPLAILGFEQTGWLAASLFILGSGVLTATFFAPMYSVTHELLEPRMRATGAAILTLGLGLVSIGMGPALVGLASDLFAAMRFGGSDYAIACRAGGAGTSPLCAEAAARGLRDALMAGSLIYIWSAGHFLLATRAMRRDRPA